ncbi:MAG TPA: ABC transporter permease subunit, partial [Halanaerobiales bacterium]|nr:ABC transporter permease subunit [Halanaerobiales bacterium]
LKVQIPIALPVIIGGIRTSTVICIGTATLAALIGAGGLGSLIYRGLQQFRTEYIVAGALFSALLALALDYGIGAVERLITSEGLRQNQG